MWLTVALALSHAILGGLFKTAVENNFDDRLNAEAEEILSLIDKDKTGRFIITRPPGNPRLNLPGSGWYWQIVSEKNRIIRSRSLWDNTLPMPDNLDWKTGGRMAYNAELSPGESVHISGRIYRIPGVDNRLLILTAGPLAEIKQAIDDFNSQLFWSLLALGTGLMAAVLFQIRYGLKPLRRLQNALKAIQNGKQNRLSGHYPEEIMPIVSEFNTVLEQSEQRLLRTRKEIGDLAHALKTPISIIQNETDGHPDSEEMVLIQRQNQIMQDRIQYQLTRARTAGAIHLSATNTKIAPVLQAIEKTMTMLHADHCPDMTFDVDENIRFQGDRQDLEEILGNILDNACKWADKKIQVFVGRDADCDAGHDTKNIMIRIDDDGPGLTPQQIGIALKRGQRLDESQPGTGLGLAIVKDIVALYQGKLDLSRSKTGGLSVKIILPGA